MHRKNVGGSEIEISSTQEKTTGTRDSSSNSKTTVFTCQNCSKMFNSEIELDFHKISAGHKKILPKKSVQCTVCNRMFSSRGNLNRHQIIHTREKASCPKCSKVFTSENRLRNHIRTQHSHCDAVVTTNVPVCKGCGETFSVEKVLTNHMKYCVHL